MSISIIAAVDENRGLGCGNELLCHLPTDLAYFKKTTLNKSIVMGHTTFLSIGKPLPKRKNIVLSRKPNLAIEGAYVASTIPEAIALADSDEVMIVGGATIYEQTIDIADKLYVTQIHQAFTADAFFPLIDESIWQCVSVEKHSANDKDPYDFDFLIYQRKEVL